MIVAGLPLEVTEKMDMFFYGFKQRRLLFGLPKAAAVF
jgi:hypothetical protein